ADEIEAALIAAKANTAPTIIACKTTIGFGAPEKAGTSGSHGAPLGAQELASTREAVNWSYEPFEVPSEVRDAWRIAGVRHARERKAWETRLADADPSKRGEFERRLRNEFASSVDDALMNAKKNFAENPQKVATRKSSELALEVINGAVAEMIGGSADLSGSNNTKTSNLTVLSADDYSGRYIHYGVREHGMAAAMNGIALHGGFIPYGGTFLVFSDYCRPSIRLAALMGLRVIFVFTHDSIGLGEDGPTHQPVEHLAALRAIPNLNVFRPCDTVETLECWQAALEAQSTPSVLALTRQGLEQLRTEHVERNRSSRGAYEIFASGTGETAVSLFATGSEVEIAVEAAKKLAEDGIVTRVVSVPSFECFARQSVDYRKQALGSAKVNIGVEAAVRMGWDRVIGSDGIFIGMDGFGASGPYKELYSKFGITADAIVAAAKDAVGE
ncbi:MAG: transketolase C-terminal domain-containing protein, partial [Pseudomonadota bacterium]